MTIKNALVVDDSKSARMMLQRLLNKMNVTTEAVESAEAALIFLDSNHPDVIFMDHMMPGMDGLEATQRIKSNPETATIPTIMYTSKEGEEYFDMARSHGAEGVLAKPADQEAVMAVIKSLNAPAANDERKPEVNTDITLIEVDKLVQKHLKLALTEAKVEMAAGLDSATQQLQANQDHQLQHIQNKMQQQYQTLQTELNKELEPKALFQHTKVFNQRLAVAVADKISQKSADQLAAIMSTNKAETDAFMANQAQTLQKQIKQTGIKAALIGATLGAGIGIIATLLLNVA